MPNGCVYRASVHDPAAMTPDDLAPLRAAGLGDLDIHDLIHATAMFANANRLTQTLGEPV